MSDCSQNVTLTLSEDEVRLVGRALQEYQLTLLEYSSAEMLDESEIDDPQIRGELEEFSTATRLLTALGLDPLADPDWADMDASPDPTPEEDTDE